MAGGFSSGVGHHVLAAVGHCHITVATALGCVLVAIPAKGSCGLGLDQGLMHLALQFRDELNGGAAARRLGQLLGGITGDEHGLV